MQELPCNKAADLESRRLLTLWDIVQRFQPELFVHLSAILESIAGPPELGVNTDAMVLSDSSKARAVEVFRGFAEECRALDLKTSVLTVDKLQRLLSNVGATYGELKRLIHELQDRVVDEMRSEFFFQLGPQEAERYEHCWKGWERIVELFPETTRDIEEMNKCLALDRYTASMFHALNVAEWGAIKLGDYIGVVDPKKGWGATSKKLEELIKSGHSKLPPTLNGKFEFLEQAHREIESMVLAWRHKIDHAANHLAIVPNAEFTPEIAQHISSAVKVFMNRLEEEMKIL